MKQKFFLAVTILLLISQIGFCCAGSSASSINNKPAVKQMPNISNEAEYAEWVSKNERIRKNEGASKTSSVKSVVSNKFSSSSKSSAK